MINYEKCEAWNDLFLAIMKISKELTEDEAKYIKANLMKKQGELMLEELQGKEH